MSQEFSLPLIYKVRVGYADTDRMGMVHHSRYLVYMEAARTELLRATGDSYRAWEDRGVLLPVTRAEVDYRQPGLYDDILHVETSLVELTRLRLRFLYKIFCPGRDNVHLATGQTSHAFMNKEGRPFRAGPEVLGKLEPLLSSE